MARVRATDPAHRRLLGSWEPPSEAGEPVGVLATTFTLDTALFEEECLARFAGVQADPDRDGALYRIEREEKLAKVLSACAVADVHHCAGKRSLRWDLLAARPSSGVMHAKISLIAWQRHVRVIVASANLTESGYRSNQECFTTLEFTTEEADRGLLDPLIVYLREVLGLTVGAGRDRAEALLDWVDENMPRTTASSRGLQRRLILIGPGRPSLFEQLEALIPSNARPSVAHVTSPFFDKELRTEGPEKKLWGLLRQRGAAEVHFHVAGEAAPESRGWRLEAPAHLHTVTPRHRSEVNTLIHPIQVTGVPVESGLENRPLHAKSILLEHDNWALLCIGSSNFTSAGTGLQDRARNFEANVVYLLRAEARESIRKVLASRFLRGASEVDAEANIEWNPALDTEGENEEASPPLPAFFSEVQLLGRQEDSYVLHLKLKGHPPPGSWQIFDDRKVLLSASSWEAQGRSEALDVGVSVDRPPPSTLRVTWGESYEAEWPVNAESAAALPMPEELRGLSLAALLDLLSSARPLNEALRNWLRHQPNDDDSEAEVAVELIDPHAKVDTSGFLMKRVQRACWAIEELMKRLAEPVLSNAAMAWRIEGPVGAQAVLNAIRKQCDPVLHDEWAFLLCELLGGLRQLKLSGAASPSVQVENEHMLKGFIAAVEESLQDVETKCTSSMREYIATATEVENA